MASDLTKREIEEIAVSDANAAFEKFRNDPVREAEAPTSRGSEFSSAARDARTGSAIGTLGLLMLAIVGFIGAMLPPLDKEPTNGK